MEPTPGRPGANVIPHTPDPQMKVEAPPERAADEPARTPRPQETTARDTAPEVAKGSPVRDMKLELTGGERRVEVRLSERGGEVRMTVRTPDAHLATALRENLSALSTRLAENGYKNDAWHPASSSGERTRTAEPSAGSASQDANTSSRQQERQPQEQGGQRHHKNFEEPKPQQKKGRDFAWLMSSLR
jgi:hypothetical protein